MIPGEFQHTEHGIDVPSFVGREAFSSQRDLGRHALLKFGIGHLQKGQQFPRQHPHVSFVDEGKAEFQGTAADGDITISKTIQNDGSVALYGLGFNANSLVQGF
jgi:hypothetical protein